MYMLDNRRKQQATSIAYELSSPNLREVLVKVLTDSHAFQIMNIDAETALIAYILLVYY